ncbi:MAG TPA: ABC transporter permease [Terriglobales bacterium]|nr:ABC transporter permease [Terriglobales bacterium]
MANGKPVLRTSDLLGFAAQHLRDSLLRNSLTTLGVSVGVASLVAMLSLGIGLQQLATKRLSRSGLFDTVVITSREWDQFNSLGPRPEAQVKEVRPLDAKAQSEIAQLPGVLEVYPEIRFVAEIKYGEQSHFVSVAALPQSSSEREVFDTLKGKFFSGPKSEEVIVHADFARLLSKDTPSLIGKELLLNYAQRMTGSDAAASANGASSNAAEQLFSSGFSVVRKQRRLKIVGVMEGEPEPALRGASRARVFLPTELAESMNIMLGSDLREIARTTSSGMTFLALTARVAKPAQVQAVEDAVKKMGFSAFSMLDVSRSLRRFFTVVDLFLGIFGSLALAVASLGIVNTLVMAILERRHEIGVMKAVGASQADVRRLFFAEAGAMGLIGGVLGVAFGWGIGRVINAGTNAYLRSRDLSGEAFWSVPWWLVAGAIGFAILVSLVAGVYPAARAARLDPIQALRYE